MEPPLNENLNENIFNIFGWLWLRGNALWVQLNYVLVNPNKDKIVSVTVNHQ